MSEDTQNNSTNVEDPLGRARSDAPQHRPQREGGYHSRDDGMKKEFTLNRDELQGIVFLHEEVWTKYLEGRIIGAS